MIFNCLSIAGTDPSGGAGMQGDLKTFSALGTYGMSVVTAVVAQSTQGVEGIHQLSGGFVTQQLEVLFQDVRVDSVKIGMLGSAEVIQAISKFIKRFNPPYVVLDPVMISSSGNRLVDEDAINLLRDELLPIVDLVTPNLPEAACLLGMKEATNEEMMRAQLEELCRLSPGVLLKGGHLHGIESVDLLKIDGEMTRFSERRIQTNNTHGTGCTLSAAIAALRPQRSDWASAVSDAKNYLTGALVASELLQVGRGRGPLHHFHESWAT